MRASTRLLTTLGCLGLLATAWLIWAIEHTEPPSLPVAIALTLIPVALAIGPWIMLVTRELVAEPAAMRVVRRVVTGTALIIFAGIVMAVAGGEYTHAMFAVLAAGAVALLGAAVFPWIFILARTVTRERAARVLAEQRAEMAAHLHDSVLQALTLIQKQAEQPAVLRLARRTERELRAWLYGGATADPHDFAQAVQAVAEEVEDRFAVSVERVAVGTCSLDSRTRAVVGAIREALTNAAKHARVRQVSLYVEATQAEVFALVRDRGAGFADVANGHRGISDSIHARMRQHGGSAAVRSTPGEGTEVELLMPLSGAM